MNQLHTKMDLSNMHMVLWVVIVLDSTISIETSHLVNIMPR